jgi:DNA-binding HxlR family transcriptional regulator
MASERRQFSFQEQAAIRVALGLLQGKWKIGILCQLQQGPARPGELRRLFPQASKKMLTQHLRQMERDGLIARTDLSGKVPHVEYSLSNLRGQAVSRLLQILVTWSADYSEPPSDGISDRKAIFSESESDRQCDSP